MALKNYVSEELTLKKNLQNNYKGNVKKLCAFTFPLLL